MQRASGLAVLHLILLLFISVQKLKSDWSELQLFSLNSIKSYSELNWNTFILALQAYALHQQVA